MRCTRVGRSHLDVPVLSRSRGRAQGRAFVSGRSKNGNVRRRPCGDTDTAGTNGRWAIRPFTGTISRARHPGRRPGLGNLLSANEISHFHAPADFIREHERSARDRYAQQWTLSEMDFKNQRSSIRFGCPSFRPPTFGTSIEMPRRRNESCRGRFPRQRLRECRLGNVDHVFAIAKRSRFLFWPCPT